MAISARSIMMTILVAIIGLVVCQATVFQTMGAKQYVISMQRCKGSTNWTLHGLWPDWAQDCKGEAFNEDKLAPIKPELEVHWRSCPEFGKTNSAFWNHEWTKHGTCWAQRTNSTQLAYFQISLDLLEDLSPRCSPALTGECRIPLDANLKPLN